MYIVYILECADATLYTWITTDIERRLKEHNDSALWAKYTRARRPVRLVYCAEFATRSEASREEIRIKKLKKEGKKKLIENNKK